MKCHHCGCRIPNGEESKDTISDTSSYRRGAYIYNTETVPLLLCRSCAASRRNTMQLFVWTAVGAAVVLAILALAKGL
jgi:hypothetical protein